MKHRSHHRSSARFPLDVQQRMCTRKRRYRTQADALDAALIAGLQRERSAYPCPLCGHWHLCTANRD